MAGILKTSAAFTGRFVPSLVANRQNVYGSNESLDLEIDIPFRRPDAIDLHLRPHFAGTALGLTFFQFMVGIHRVR